MIFNFNTYKEKFRAKATNIGYSENNIVKCLKYSEILYNNRVPIIYNLTHLSKLTGYKRNYIIQAAVVSKYSDAYYRYYKIPKKNGGTRTIQEPLPNLKDIQHWILKNILYKIHSSNYAKAYIKNKGLKENLKFHKNQLKIFSIDIKDFFPTINYEKVYLVFKEVGYSDTISKYLAKLCCLNESLPQGAPTSPYISNLVMRNIDNRIGSYCLEREIRFTRYADDLTFSGDFDETELNQFVIELLNDEGFELNDSKTKSMFKSQRQIVTGVIVNEKIQLPKEKRRKIRQTLYFINKFGLDSHIEKIGMNKRNYLNHLIGQIGFGLYLNPNDSELKEYMKTITKLKKDLKF
ncbi:retron St85 family RNA-directed DNA polymerase [Xanthomarina gelatinilytica]|uniref:retron St85 family RNA-directed DNA polymerase n=1 Tax=Xanthomarina gelatinilytica TaxID=1137281 RepID=UPI003AA7F1C2